jgi:SAM-dependent methyltransferase
MTPLDQHQVEIEKNLAAWRNKPLLQKIYVGFYERILRHIDTDAPGAVVEIGSGIGNLKAHLPRAICTDLFPNPWLDLVCDGYELPFVDGSVSHLILFDVFHHLRRPRAFLNEARRVLTHQGRVILFEPFISTASFPVYGLLHHEPVAWNSPIDFAGDYPRPRDYYAAQGNATRLFFRDKKADWLSGWQVAHAEAFSAFSYLLSGGYSKPAMYPAALLGTIRHLDSMLSCCPNVFGGRCLVELRREGAQKSTSARTSVR